LAIYGVVCVILGLAVSVELRLVTDRQTDRRRHDDSIYRASIESRGKMAPAPGVITLSYCT